MTKVTPACCGPAIRLLLALTLLVLPAAAAAQSLRINADPEELERRARADSNDPAAQYNAAMGWWSRERYDRADTALSRAVALDPSFAAAWLARAVVHDRNNRYWNQLRRQGDTAVAAEQRRRQGYYRRAFLIDPFVDVRVLGSVIRREWGDWDTNDFTEGFQYLVEGRYREAHVRFETLVRLLGRRGIDRVPEILLWFHQLAAVRADSVAAAITSTEALLNKSLAREASDTVRFVPLATNEFRYILAALYGRAGRRAEAARLYQEVLTNDIGHYAAHVQLARLFEAAGDHVNAVAERRLAVEVSPEDHTLQIDLGTALARANRWEEAEVALRQATEMGPRDPRGFYRLGIVSQQLGRRAEARAALERFLELAPSRQANVIADARSRLAALGTP